MADKTNIQWCDSTVNFWQGCTKVSEGCKECYAETRDKRHLQEKVSHWGKGAPRLRSKSALKQAEALNAKPWICDDCGHAAYLPETHNSKGQMCKIGWQDRFKGWHRRRIFSLSLGDWLDDEVPMQWFAELIHMIIECDQVIWILCTKRPEVWRKRMLELMSWTHHEGLGGGLGEAVYFEEHDLTAIENLCIDWIDGRPPQHIILLASVENQKWADERIPKLLDIPGYCHGLSLEPLLGPVDLSKWIHWSHSKDAEGIKDSQVASPISWAIVGGESGSNARPCDVRWIEAIVTQCEQSEIPVFVKQLGAKPFQSAQSSGSTGFDLQLKHPKGEDKSEWPKHLQIQEWPEGF